MKDFTVSVRKLTDIDLLHEACETTFIGKSNASLLSLYKAEHSPARTQLFWITLKNIPLFISTHLIRHHVGSVPFQLTCRDDRKGGNNGLQAVCDKMNEKLDSMIGFAQDSYYRDAESVIQELQESVVWIKENTDRNTPVNLSLLVNAQSLIDMSKLRLCKQAHIQTIKVFNAIKCEIQKVDSELASMMVPKCVYRNGLCGELKCCGYNSTNEFKTQLMNYRLQFSNKQMGIK